MPNILVANPKGGCGKTTLATSIACHYANQNIHTILIDRDPQKSASDWHVSRPKNCSTIELITVNSNDNFKPDNYPSTNTDTVVIQDMPAGWQPELHSPLLNNNQPYQLLIPILPSPVDIKAGLRFLMQLYRSGILEQHIRAGMIANRTRSHLRFHQALMDFLQRVQIPLIGTVRDSQNYIRAMENGISIFDLPARVVQKDLAQWQGIFDWLDGSEGE
jgi:chromosome partitioning protein